jgi:hypothetical protein
MPVPATRAVAAVLAIGLGVGCDRSAPPPLADPASATPVADAATPTAPAAPTTPARMARPAPEPEAASPAELPVVAMDAEGVRFIDAATGSARLLPFTSAQREVLATLRKAIPGASWGQPETTDCGDDVVLGTNGLALSFRDGRFLGWAINPPSKLATAAGIGLGSTRAELEAIQVPEVMESTLGTEFVAGGIAGLFESAKPNARITHLWAGETGIAR